MKNSIMRYKKDIPYLSVAKWRRRENVIRLKNKIKRQQDRFHDNRLFYTYDLIRTEDGENINLSWMDIEFPSKKYNDINYLGFICTCQYQLNEYADNVTWDKIYDETQNIPKDDFIFEPSTDNELKPKEKRTSVLNISEAKIKQYDGRTRFEEFKRRIKLWWGENKGTHTMFPYVALHCNEGQNDIKVYDLFEPINVKNINSKKYALAHWYVLLNAMIDTAVFNVEIVNNFIIDFYNNGEKAWISSDPIPQDHLLYDPEWMKILETGISNPLIM